MEGSDLLVDDYSRVSAAAGEESNPGSKMDRSQVVHESSRGVVPPGDHSNVNPPSYRKTRRRRTRTRHHQCFLSWGCILLIVTFLVGSDPPVVGALGDEESDYVQSASPPWSSSASSLDIAPSAVSGPSGTTGSGESETYFVSGLANSIRRINGTLLKVKSLREPFQLHFRTACPFGNILYQDSYTVGFSAEGKLIFSSPLGSDARIRSSSSGSLADGFWHTLNFNGSLLLPNSDEPVVPLPLTSPQPTSLESSFLKFFDGFVGCVKLTGPTGEPIPSSSSGIEDYLSSSGGSSGELSPEEYSYSDYFQLSTLTPYGLCEDPNLNLADVHPCPDPSTFVLCSKCLNRGRCEVVEEEDPALLPTNVCLCPQSSFGGKYCEIPVGSVMEESSDSPLQPLSAPSNDGSSNEVLMTAGANLVQSNVSSNGTSARPYSGRSENLSTTSSSTPPTSTSSTTTTTTTLHPSVSDVRPSNVTDAPAGCPCKHGGVCLSSTATTSMEVVAHICSCEGTGYYGERCELENLFCRSSPCVHGICQPKADSYQCYCLPGYAGSNCDINFNECLSSPCGSNGVCVDDVNTYQCNCNPGFIGTRCETEINECELYAPCQNGGTCQDAVANYTCDCLQGFAGHNCSININECESSPCQNGGHCIDGINSYSCNCSNTGFEGFYCDREIDECQVFAPCQHGGTCKDRHKGFTCHCHTAYQGTQCEFDYEDCNSNPCQHNSTCYEKSNASLYNAPADSSLPRIFQGTFSYENASGYECQCIKGFEGNNCETNIDECTGYNGQNPCHFGKCIDGINNFTCDCNNGYTGPLCETEINECEPSTGNPCVRGTCIDQVADYLCQCPEGYGSKNCSVPLTGCNGVTCFNAGTCSPTYINSTHGHRCVCAPGWAGGLCQRSTTLSFGGSKGGYAELVSDEENYRSRYAMSFRFRTTLSEVLIAVGQGSTYFMLTLSGGKLNLQSSLLNSLKGISSGNNVSNADWHQAWVSINESHIALGVNQEQTIHPIQTEPEQPVETGFNTTVLGGATSGLSALTNLPSFVGCIQDIQINDRKIVPEEKPPNLKYDPALVQIGCQRTEQCAANNSPCLNGGTCTDLWTKFECLCPRPFLGEICSHEYVAATFGHENSTVSVIEVHIPNEVGRKFDKSFEISMFVRTREPRGTIFLLKEERKENNGLFLEAYVEDDGQLGVLAKLDEGKEETYKVGGLAINDGEPHLISFQRERGLVKINVNGTEHFRRSLPLKPTQVFNPAVMYVGGIPPLAEPESSSSSPVGTENSSSVGVSTGRPDDLGAGSSESPIEMSSISSSHVVRAIWNNKMEPFKGTIQDVRVNLSTESSSHHQNPMLNRYVVEFFPLTQVNKSFLMGEPLGQVIRIGQVLRGVVSDNTCKTDPCLNGGECQVTWNDFKCKCPEAFDGKMCEHLLPCAIVTCPIGSTCKNLYSGKVNGFECEAEASFDGTGTVSPHYHFRAEAIENLTFNQVSFRYRAKHGGSILHLSHPANGTSLSISLEEVHNPANNVSEHHLVLWLNGTRFSDKLPKALDGAWHSIKLSLHPENGNLLLHYDGTERKNPLGTHFPQNLIKGILAAPFPEIILGSGVRKGRGAYTLMGAGGGDSGNVRVHDESLHHDYFRGCLGDFRIGEFRLPFVSTAQLMEINTRNVSLITTTAPAAFYMDEPSEGGLRLGCVLCYDQECQNGGQCEDALEKYDCKCQQGYAGNFCGFNVQECEEENRCAFGSTCIDQIANYTCNCAPGFTGWWCDTEINECEPNPCQSLDTEAVCEDLIGSYTCHCSSDYIGPECGSSKLASCADDPCEHGASCVTTPLQPDGTNFTCNCQRGFTGRTCGAEIDFCRDQNCSGHGNCVNKWPNGFVCHCQQGWTKLRCEQSIDDCEVSGQPCKNGGKCMDGHISYTCDCAGTGFKGKTCEEDINECAADENTCAHKSNNSICVNLPGSFECMCPPGFCGSACDILDPCTPSYSCANKGTCEPICDPGSEPLPSCKCPHPWTNDQWGNCTELRSVTQAFESTTINVILIVIPVLAAFLVSVIIAAVILVRMARKKRATRGVYSPSQQEYSNPRIELDNVLKPPPEERLI